MTSLRDMNERMAQWMNEKPQFDGGIELRLQKDDMAIIQFASSGNDGDQLIKVYRSHIVSVAGRNGKSYNQPRYCPIQSGEDKPCPLCEQGIKDIKERMSMWFWVSNIFHTTLPAEKTFGQVNYEGRLYFNEEVNAFKIWHTSAWRESPWQDINKLNEIYKGLHNFTAQLVVVGQDLGRRFKVYAIPQSPMVTSELYAAAKAQCEPIPDILARQLASAVAVNPQVNAAQPTSGAVVTPFVLPGTAANVPSFSLPGAPTPAVMPTHEPEKDDLPFEGPTDPEEERKPLKSMF